MKRYIILAFLAAALMLPLVSIAAPACTDAPSSSLCNPFETNAKFPKITNLTGFIIFVLTVFGGTAGIASVLYITFAGFRFLISQGNEERVTKAKSAIQWTMSGLVLMLVSYVLVRAIEKSLRYKGVANRDQINNPIAIKNFVELYQALIEAFFGIMALVAILMIVISGYRYITSAGNEETAGEAKKTIFYAVLGMAIAIFAYILVHAAGTLFGEG